MPVQCPMENGGGNGRDFWLLAIGLSSSFSGCLVGACCMLDFVGACVTAFVTEMLTLSACRWPCLHLPST